MSCQQLQYRREGRIRFRVMIVVGYAECAAGIQREIVGLARMGDRGVVGEQGAARCEAVYVRRIGAPDDLAVAMIFHHDHDDMVVSRNGHACLPPACPRKWVRSTPLLVRPLFTRPLLSADQQSAVTLLVPVRLDDVRCCHADNVQQFSGRRRCPRHPLVYETSCI